MPDSSTAAILQPSSTVPPGDLDLDAIIQTLIVGVSGLTGDLVRPRWQPTQPKMPDIGTNWCAIGVTSITPDDGPAIIHQPTLFFGQGLYGAGPYGGSSDGSDVLFRHEQIEVLASFYGTNAQQISGITRDGLGFPQNN